MANTCWCCNGQKFVSNGRGGVRTCPVCRPIKGQLLRVCANCGGAGLTAGVGGSVRCSECHGVGKVPRVA